MGHPKVVWATRRIDAPLAETRSSATTYYQQDALGSITSLSTPAGALTNTYTYDSFGKLTASAGTVTNPFQYSARESDVETGLYFYRARYYEGNTGRFLNEDPVGFAVSYNFYPYVSNNPINRIDPTGLATVVNNTGSPILVSGNPGGGHGEGSQVYAVIPSGGVVYGGASRPIPAYPTIEEAMAAAFGPQPPKPPAALIYDVDFYDATALAQSTKPDALACKRKIIGDEQGPKVTLTRPWYDFGLGLVNEEAGPWDVISAITRYFKR